MKRNTDSRNLCPTWDLTAEELETFYRGAGAATVVLDEHDTIIECHYLDLAPEPDGGDEQQTYIKTVFPAADRQMDGMMSCTQFCEVPLPLAADDGAVAAHIQRYGALMAEQVERAGGWPESVVLPEPRNDIEREALRLFIGEVADTTGATVRISHPGKES